MYVLITGKMNWQLTEILDIQTQEFEDFVNATNTARFIPPRFIAMIASSTHKIIYGWNGSSKQPANKATLEVLQALYDRWKAE